jgi:lactoylglutathione lyase
VTARAIGLNHIALEVGDIDEALRFYARLFEFELRGRIGDRMAFIDLGDQFIALAATRSQPLVDARGHFGLVVDDKDAVRAALDEAGVSPLGGRGLEFRDPWGNLFQIVQYDEIQFTKAPGILGGMGLEGLGKRPEAQEELRAKGLLGDR